MKIRCSLCIFLLLLACAGSDESGMEVNLTGPWRIRFRDNMEYARPVLDDGDWDCIQVPASWEEGGFPGFDGYAWYRKKFQLSNKLERKVLTLDLGLIHDADEVYINGHFLDGKGSFPPILAKAVNTWRLYDLPKDRLHFGKMNVIALRVYNEEGKGGIVTVYFNGEMIGNTGEFPNDHSNRTDYMYWSHDRFYFIPTQLILPEEKNTIAVCVYDFGQHGGIYEGPIGIVSQEKVFDSKTRPN